MDRRIDVSEVPLVSRDLAAGMKVAGLEHQLQLALPKTFIHQRQGCYMKGEIPGGIPGIFPFVRHRDDIGVSHVTPTVVADGPLIRRERLNAVLLEPLADVIEKELL